MRCEDTGILPSPERRRLIVQAGIAGLFLCLPQPLLAAAAKARPYVETIAVLQSLYASEFLSRERYLAFAHRALAEDHANIAHLFTALAASEAVHARNYLTLLQTLGVQPEKPDVGGIRVQGTRENLRYAAEDELAEVDKEYPALLARLRPEGHRQAMEKVRWSWQAERQHRDLIKQILAGTGIFFGVLSEKFRQSSIRYFVCDVCGSTLIELPVDKCPVCGQPVEVYHEILRVG